MGNFATSALISRGGCPAGPATRLRAAPGKNRPKKNGVSVGFGTIAVAYRGVNEMVGRQTLLRLHIVVVTFTGIPLAFEHRESARRNCHRGKAESTGFFKKETQTCDDDGLFFSFSWG
jgi:hypothetical protein